MSEEFTNRRGHSLKVDEEEPIVPVKQAAEPTPTAKPKPIKRRRHRTIRLPWKWIGLVLGAVVLVALLTLEFARFSYVSSVNAARQQVKDVVAGDVAAAGKQSTLTSGTISSLSSKFKSISMSLCPGGLLDNYATLYPRSKQALDDCAVYRTKLETLIAALDTLADETKYLEQLQPIVSPVTQPLSDRFAVLASQQENWKGVADSVRALSVPVSFQAAHATFAQRVNTVASLWIDLVAASDDQDSAKFNETQARLSTAYGAVRASAEEFEAVLGATQTNLTHAYVALQ